MSRIMAAWQRKRYGVDNLWDGSKHLSVRRVRAVVKSASARYYVTFYDGGLPVDCAMKQCVPNRSMYSKRWNKYLYPSWKSNCFDIGGTRHKSVGKVFKVIEVDSEFTQLTGVSLKSGNGKFNITNMKITLNLASSNQTSPSAPKLRGNNGASPAVSESKNIDDNSKSATTGNINNEKAAKNKDKDGQNGKSGYVARARERDSNDRQKRRTSRSRGADTSHGRGGARGSGNDKGG